MTTLILTRKEAAAISIGLTWTCSDSNLFVEFGDVDASAPEEIVADPRLPASRDGAPAPRGRHPQRWRLVGRR